MSNKTWIKLCLNICTKNSPKLYTFCIVKCDTQLYGSYFLYISAIHTPQCTPVVRVCVQLRLYLSTFNIQYNASFCKSPYKIVKHSNYFLNNFQIQLMFYKCSTHKLNKFVHIKLIIVVVTKTVHLKCNTKIV